MQLLAITYYQNSLPIDTPEERKNSDLVFVRLFVVLLRLKHTTTVHSPKWDRGDLDRRAVCEAATTSNVPVFIHRYHLRLLRKHFSRDENRPATRRWSYLRKCEVVSVFTPENIHTWCHRPKKEKKKVSLMWNQCWLKLTGGQKPCDHVSVWSCDVFCSGLFKFPLPVFVPLPPLSFFLFFFGNY